MIQDACIDRGVKRVAALSAGKACSTINLYGVPELASNKLFIGSNAYSSQHDSIFSVARYENFIELRVSVFPFFLGEKGKGSLSITDERMTWFMVSLECI